MFTYSVYLFDLLSFILTYLSYLNQLYSTFKSNSCCRDLIFPVVQKSLTNLNPYRSCLVLFFCLLACFFCCASGQVEHMWRVGICLNYLLQKKKVFRRKLCFVIVLPLFYDIDYFEVTGSNQFKAPQPISKQICRACCFCFNGAQKESTCTSKYSWKKFNLFPESPEGLLKLSLTSWNALSKFASAELLLLL